MCDNMVLVQVAVMSCRVIMSCDNMVLVQVAVMSCRVITGTGAGGGHVMSCDNMVLQVAVMSCVIIWY